MPNEFETLLVKMDEGFGKVYDKIDDLRDDFVEHMPICAEKFAGIDKRLTVQEAVNGERQAQARIKRDWGQWFVRLTMGTIATGAIVLLWKLLIGTAKIVVGG